MEKAILKTLIYADLFNFALKAWEIHKWLIGKKATLRQVEKALRHLSQKSEIKTKDDLYFLPKRGSLVKKRQEKEKTSKSYLRQIRLIAQLFKIIPWIKLVGVSGSLAMENSKQSDDIDLFIITQKNRLWISRIFLLLILELSNKRRKRGEKIKDIAGKICINLLINNDSLAFSNKDIYLAHEVLQTKVLWQRDGVYSRFLSENNWVFKYLPNWTSGEINKDYGSSRLHSNSKYFFFERSSTAGESRSYGVIGYIEEIVKWLQLRYMGQPEGKERIENGALFFHPKDCREKILTEYLKKTSSFLRN